jgi:predicted sulfurtransferase
MIYKVVNFYVFKKMEQPLAQTQEALRSIFESNNTLGTVLLSPEGANFSFSPNTATKSEQDSCIMAVLDQIKTRTEFV